MSEQRTAGSTMISMPDNDPTAATATEEGPGYTSESLRMLESAEGQTNAVFACYGSAAQRAQNFEDGLARFLLVYNRITKESLRLEDLEAGLHKLTMGRLIKDLSKFVTFQDGTYQSYFDEA